MFSPHFLGHHCLLTNIPIVGLFLRSPLLSVSPTQLGRRFTTLVPRGEAGIAQAIETKNFVTRQLRNILDGLPPGPHEAPPTTEVAWQHAQSTQQVVHPLRCIKHFT